jgi:hypothetical protein
MGNLGRIVLTQIFQSCSKVWSNNLPCLTLANIFNKLKVFEPTQANSSVTGKDLDGNVLFSSTR